MYDMTDPTTAASLFNWLKEIEMHAGNGIPIVLVGNKVDAVASTDPELVRRTRETVDEILASYPELTHFECSAKLGLHVEDVFIGLTKKLIAKRQEQYQDGLMGGGVLGSSNRSHKSGSSLRIGSTFPSGDPLGIGRCCGTS